jgi:hypothetical protein
MQPFSASNKIFTSKAILATYFKKIVPCSSKFSEPVAHFENLIFELQYNQYVTLSGVLVGCPLLPSLCIAGLATHRNLKGDFSTPPQQEHALTYPPDCKVSTLLSTEHNSWSLHQQMGRHPTHHRHFTKQKTPIRQHLTPKIRSLRPNCSQ